MNNLLNNEWQQEKDNEIIGITKLLVIQLAKMLNIFLKDRQAILDLDNFSIVENLKILIEENSYEMELKKHQF